MTIRIHHATAKKAEKLGIELTIDGDRFVARDTLHNIDQEFSGLYAVALLEEVLKRRDPSVDAVKTVKAVDDEADEADEADDENESGEKVVGVADDDDDEADDEEEEKVSHSVVKEKYKIAYVPTDDTNGDEFARAFSSATHTVDGIDKEVMYTIARDNGVDPARWSHLNPGMQRMNLGNVLRKMVRHGMVVTIGSIKFEPPSDAAPKPARSPKKIGRGALK